MPDHASWNFPRGPAAARILLAIGAERGLPSTACLAGTGLTPAALSLASCTVEAGQELAIARNLITDLGDAPGLGADAGRRFTLGSFGVWGFALMTSPTVRDVVRIGVRYAGLSFVFMRPSVEQDAVQTRVVLDDEEIPVDVRAFFVERELAKLATLLPVVLGPGRRGIWFETRLANTNVQALRAVVPDIDLRGGHARHLFRIPSRLLEMPLPQADPAASRELERQCQEMLDRRRQRRGLAARVRSQLLASLPAPPDMATVAQELAMNERTLRRQLDAEGTSFRQLSDEVRGAIATDLLVAAGLTVDDVALRLGYHDAAGFTRAYKRWTGTTPGRHRRSGVEAPAASAEHG